MKQFFASMSVHKRTAFFAMIMGVWLTTNNIVWVLAGYELNFHLNITLNWVITVVCLSCYLFENKITKNILMFSIASVAILSNFTYPNNRYAFIIELVVIALALFWRSKRGIFYFVIVSDMIISTLGEYYFRGSLHPVINVVALMACAVPLVWMNGKDIFEVRVKKEVQKQLAEVELQWKKKYLNLAVESRIQLEKNNEVLSHVAGGNSGERSPSTN